eukprot:12835392-Prorocentrum_lima.AAC.1
MGLIETFNSNTPTYGKRIAARVETASEVQCKGDHIKCTRWKRRGACRFASIANFGCCWKNMLCIAPG